MLKIARHSLVRYTSIATTINNLMLMMFISENGVTALEFVQSDAEDYDDIGLTKFGKNRVLKILTEVKTVSRSS